MRTPVPHLRKKTASAIVAKSIASDFIQTTLDEHLKIFTDGSVLQKPRSSTAAFCIPALNLSSSGRNITKVSSSTAELIAVEYALRNLQTLSPQPAPQPAVILTDSRSALLRIQHPKHEDTVAWQVRDLIRTLEDLNYKVHLHWIPSHVGIDGNEHADNLAAAAHQLDANLPAPIDPDATRTAIRDYITMVHLQTANSPAEYAPACPTRGLPRHTATLKHRLRTGSAFTPAFLRKLGRTESPYCSSCRELSDICHLLFCCGRYHSERQSLLQRLQGTGTTLRSSNDLTHHQGSRYTRRNIRDALLSFLEDTGLSSVL
ncbi:uncharacterized protein LOC135399872 [Ornithodoros turicata]|uniref:uncharacterized protein LOC135399872 n=1 Tax=Ornithodoros turicata TaxID=34597 RepID=UPI0031389056